MKPMIYSFLESIKKALPNVSEKIDAPAQPEGHWFVDLELNGHKVVAEWHPQKGFGVSSALENGYGEGPEEVFQNGEAAATRVIDLLRTRTYTRPPDAVLLREIRALSKLTQEEIAKRLGIAQGAVSRMERRRDMSISTLRRLVGAMGGELELVARFPDRILHIGQFNGDDGDVEEEAACIHASDKLSFFENPPASTAQSTRELKSALAGWLDKLNTLCPTPLTLGILDSADVVCRTEGASIFIDHKMAKSVSVRTTSPIDQVCIRLLSHEVAHHLMSCPHESKPSPVAAELNADHFAGWMDGVHQYETSIGAALFYELGCTRNACTHPTPRSRLDAYLNGYKEGTTGRPHQLVGGEPNDFWSSIRSRQSASRGVLMLDRCEASSVDLRYLVLRSSSLERTHCFYSALGVSLTEEKHGVGPTHYSVTIGDSVLEFYPCSQQARSARIGLRVRSIEESLGRIRARGFSKSLVHRDDKRAMLRDPDGNDVELTAA